MLDAFIIRRIKNKEAGEDDAERPPLRIEIPLPPARPDLEPQHSNADDRERGIVEIDFSI